MMCSDTVRQTKTLTLRRSYLETTASCSNVLVQKCSITQNIATPLNVLPHHSANQRIDISFNKLNMYINVMKFFKI
jgi:hypothetical protein